MVRLRMQRFGRRNHPFFRIAAIDKRTRRDGRVIEQLGWYDPIAADPTKQINLNVDRIKHWLSVGAQPSDTVRDFLAKQNLLTPKLVETRESERKARRELIDARRAAEPAKSE